MSQKLATFSGGGWNSLSAIYGMTAGALDALEQRGLTRDLDNLFANIDTISANSGGTWALTTLASSNSINTTFKTKSGTSSITNSGYLGNVREAFETLPRFGEFNEERPLFSASVGFNFNWNKLVQDLVYTPAKDIPDSNFVPGSLMNWAQNKQLVFATGLGAIKARSIFDRTLPPQPMVVARSGRFRPLNNIEAAAYSSHLPNEAQIVPLSLELNGQTETNSAYRIPGGINTRIDYNSVRGLRRSSIQIDTEGDSSQLPLTSPSVFSSAALAIDSNSDAAGNTNKLAPLVGFSNGRILDFERTPRERTEEEGHRFAKREGLSRTMDGAYIDNSSIAYGLSALESESGLKNNFEISAFINTSSGPSDWVSVALDDGSRIRLPSNVTMLFGIGINGTSLAKDDAYPNPIIPDGFIQPSAVVFKRDSLTGISTEPNWVYESNDDNWRIEQRTINVTTNSNRTFDLPENINGTLNLFIFSNPSSNLIAFNNNILDQYENNFNGYREALNSIEGSNLIANAFYFN
ncbi:hypothetical protein [Synechococcus sp. UW179A]|uniref:hypothetical protein n=1 Tax=Synechococcus sp. UW179A TaxID=2575510 RepID=UPI000E0E574F|nr:hypothetical protein [Synechococcus sp. UW179A]